MQQLLIQVMATQKRSFKTREELEEDEQIRILAEILVEGFLWPQEHQEGKKPIREEGKDRDKDQE